MDFDLDQRTARLSVGEFSEFTLGPRDSTGGPSGIWRAQLGTHWHNQLRAQTTAERADALFEIPITGRVVHHGWTLTLTGRIDQLIPSAHGITLREIKTVTRDLPADDTELRAAYPSYFIQLATYAALARFDPTSLPISLQTPPPTNDQCHVLRDIPSEDSAKPTLPPRPILAELHFVEVASGLAQTITLTSADDVLFRAQLERVCEFLDLRHRARERLRHLRFRPPFTELRAGQETTQADLAAALAKHPIVLFEAPTGFGKTGALLELALTQLRAGRCERVLYLTSKATGQLQVMRTLGHMIEPATTPASPSASQPSTLNSQLAGASSAPVTVWLVRPKHEHCVNTVFHCSRDACAYLNGAEARWPRSGLSRFYLFENEPRDIASLRAAGRAAQICPYEITRAALAFNDVWIGDYNYVFSPSTRGLFYEQPGFDPARTLLVIDEAHNLPSRVADVYSHTFSAADASALVESLHRLHAPQKLLQAADHWSHFLRQRDARDSLPLADEDDARELLAALASQITTTPLDTQELGQPLAELLWQIPSCIDILGTVDVPRLWWSPRSGELVITCLDAAAAIGPTLRSFNAVLLASATLTPTDTFTAALGLDTPPPSVPQLSTLNPQPSASSPPPDRLGSLNKRATKKLFKQLTSAADLLKVEEARELAAPTLVRATAPWRDHAFDVAIDTRVDTSYQQRARHTATTAATLATLVNASRSSLTPPPQSTLHDPSASPSTTTHNPLSTIHASATGHWSLVTGHFVKNAVAAFFPSYAYAETLQRELAATYPEIRVALQPRLPDLAAQTAWVEQALASSDILFLVLGSSFAEGIDLLGGRISHAIVVGPALPEVNAVQRARLAAFAPLGRDAAAQRVYQIPGIQKVNQALGRLVRAPGQHAKILLHCRRFAEESYSRLLAPEYRTSHLIEHDTDLPDWL